MKGGAYLQAALPEPYVIFGARLLPLSIGRYRLLERFSCSFVAGGNLTMEDLLLGILICSMPVKEFLSFVAAPDWDPQLKKWSQRIRREMKEDPYFSLPTKFGLFQAYLDEGSRTPDFWDENGDEGGGSTGGHWLQNLEVVLRSELGYTGEEIEEGSLSKALTDALYHAQAQGQIRIIDSDELDLGNANTELLQAFMKGGPCPASN